MRNLLALGYQQQLDRVLVMPNPELVCLESHKRLPGGRDLKLLLAVKQGHHHLTTSTSIYKTHILFTKMLRNLMDFTGFCCNDKL